jgi:hypothetical protein
MLGPSLGVTVLASGGVSAVSGVCALIFAAVWLAWAIGNGVGSGGDNAGEGASEDDTETVAAKKKSAKRVKSAMKKLS